MTQNSNIKKKSQFQIRLFHSLGIWNFEFVSDFVLIPFNVARFG